VIDGRLYWGAQDWPGIWPHHPRPIGATVQLRLARLLEAMVSGRSPSGRASCDGKSQHLGNRRCHELTAVHPSAAVQGDAFAEGRDRHGGHLLGLALGSLVNVLNPDAVTLSGDAGDGRDVAAAARGCSIAYGPASGTLIRLSELGEDAGLSGRRPWASERLGR
jgi:predicted NBD/HSP70 family sugar kinase